MAKCRELGSLNTERIEVEALVYKINHKGTMITEIIYEDSEIADHMWILNQKLKPGRWLMKGTVYAYDYHKRGRSSVNKKRASKQFNFSLKDIEQIRKVEKREETNQRGTTRIKK